MEIFDSLYRPDTPSQRKRLVAISAPTVLAGLLPWAKPLYNWAGHARVATTGADVLATVLHLVGVGGPYPSGRALVRGLLVAGAAAALLPGLQLQLRVMRDFGPGSRTLRLSKWLFCLEMSELVALYWAWPKH